MAHDVFISHSSVDKTTADALCAQLEADGVRCWIAPRDIRPGETWGAAIIEAISNARVMLIVFSSEANDSKQVMREVERAVEKNAVIVPFRVEDVRPSGDMEYFLSATHWMDALSGPLESNIQKLSATIQAIVREEDGGAEPAAPAPAPAIEPKRSRRLLPAIAALLLIAGGGAAAAWYFMAPGEQSRSGPAIAGNQGQPETAAQAPDSIEAPVEVAQQGTLERDTSSASATPPEPLSQAAEMQPPDVNPSAGTAEPAERLAAATPDLEDNVATAQSDSTSTALPMDSGGESVSVSQPAAAAGEDSVATAATAPTGPVYANPAVAVLGFSAGRKTPYQQSLPELIVDGLVNDGSFDVVERNRLEAVAGELAFQSTSGFVSPEDAVQFGSMLGARLLVLGHILDHGEERQNFSGYGVKSTRITSRLTARIEIIDVETGLKVFSKVGESSDQKQVVQGQYAATTTGQLATEIARGFVSDMLASDRIRALTGTGSGTDILVAIDSDPPDADVSIDGTYYGTSGQPISIKSGMHEITVSLPGYLDWSKRVMVQEGTRIVARLQRDNTERAEVSIQTN
jgi:curli biogenesis system outer membrane secretion channel CsgG